MLGIINVQGQVVPVISLRKCFGLPDREPDVNDQMVIAQASAGAVALVVDAVDVIECLEEAAAPWAVGRLGCEAMGRIVVQRDELVLLCDLDGLLALGQDPHAAAGAPDLASGECVLGVSG